jgi:hypothetical protein
VVSEPTDLITLMRTRSVGMADEGLVSKETKALGSRMDQMQSQLLMVQTVGQTELLQQVQKLIDANNMKLQEMWGATQRQSQKDKGVCPDVMGQSFYEGEPSGQEGNHSSDGFQTRSMKFDFPCFDGEDPETWSSRAGQFFDYYCTPDKQRLSISSFHMEGKALSWFQELKSSGSLSSWDEFLRAMKIRFGNGSYDDPMENLTNLKQVGSLEDYKTQFDTLATKVHTLPDFHKLSMFLGGLRDEIRLPVRMFNPKTLIDAYSLARIQEESVKANRRVSRPAWHSSSYNQSYSGGNINSVGGYP